MGEYEEGEVGFWNSPSSPFLRPVRSLRTAQSRKYNLLIARRRINMRRDEGGENTASPAAASLSESILFLSPPVHITFTDITPLSPWALSRPAQN